MLKKRRKSISLFLFLVCLATGAGRLPGEVKTVYIPEKVEVEENAAIETRVKNLSEQEIFGYGYMYHIDDFIYYQQGKPSEIFKLDLQGNVLGRLKKIGEGPGEYTDATGFSEYMGNISFLDYYKMKFIVYTKNFIFFKETRLKSPFLHFFVNDQNEIVLYGKGGYDDYYFYVYSPYAAKLLRKFGKTLTTFSENEKTSDFDGVRLALYVPESDGVWASFQNRYDLRYYEKERLTLEIKGSKGFFKGEENEMMGRKYVTYHDRSCGLAKVDNQLYYFYAKNKSYFCDIFDLTCFTLLRRIKLQRNYWYSLTHLKGNVFYGAIPDKQNEDEDVILYRIEIKSKQEKNINDNQYKEKR